MESRDEHRQQEKVRRTGWRTIACGGCLALIALAVGLVLLGHPILNGLSSKATCGSCLRQIGLACHMYADDHDGAFPPSFRELVPTYVDNPKVLMCPTCYGTTWQDFHPGGTVKESSSSYTYVPGYLACMPGDIVLAYDRSDSNHGLKGRCVLFLDAHPEWWPASRQAEFQERLARQQDALRRWREAGARPEDAGRFFGRSGAESPREPPK